MENAVKIIDYFSDVFEIDYMLPKADLLAVHSFSHGAMENWGLVTYRTTAILWDAKFSDPRYKQRVAYVVAHELAHQWFGNLVTMSWWDSLWLNEGFATWVGWLAVDHFYPEWDYWTRFNADATQMALTLDSLEGSHPVQVEVKNALDINQLFDAISYQKGASCIRMISAFLGEKIFLKGVSNYLKTHKYGNAKTEDLWKAVSEVSGVDTTTIMYDWIRRTGYPVLVVAEEIDGITIQQKRFLLEKSRAESLKDDKLWHIPISFAESSENPFIFNSRDKAIKDTDLSFYKINKDCTGFFRVNYPPNRLDVLGKECKLVNSGKSTRLSVNDRIGLVADAAALAMSGQGHSTGFLSLVSHLNSENSFSVWTEVLARLEDMQSAWYLRHVSERDQIKQFVHKLVSGKVKELGWDSPEGESFLTSMLRGNIIDTAGAVGDKDVIAEAKKRFKAYVGGNENAITPLLKRSVFKIVLSQNDCSLEDYEAVLKEYQSAKTADGKEVALICLGSVTNPDLINKSLEFFFSGQIPNQDVYAIATALATNISARDTIWETVKKNYDGIMVTQWGSNPTILEGFIRRIIKVYASMDKYNDIVDFFKNRETGAFVRSLAQGLEMVQVRAQWVERDAPLVKTYLDSY